MRLLLTLLLAAGCKTSALPWSDFEIKLEAGSEARIHVEGSAPLGFRGETEMTVKGPATLKAKRDGTLAVEPAPHPVPAEDRP